MKNVLKISLLVFLIFFILTSCIRPDENSKKETVVDLLRELLERFSEDSKNEQEKFSLWAYLKRENNIVYSFNKDTRITVTTVPAQMDDEVLLYSVGKNQLKVVRPVYVTYIDNWFCYSFDNETWISTKNDKEQGIRGIDNFFEFHTNFEKNHFEIFVEYTLKQGHSPVIKKIKGNREVIHLKKGMTFTSEVKLTKITDLNKKILYIPADTTLTGKLNIQGNMLKGNTGNGKISIQSLTDIYFYIRKKFFALSFDNKKWNENVLFFEVIPEIEITAFDENNILIDYTIFLDYQKNRLSLSVINLLM
ncbi:MAG: hypothetical protein MJB14_15765 [Spirochaetes bacterium]|nr:hypothetical protein [Spirochaetota bacterium]